MGRLRGQAEADEDRVQRRPGRGRHLPRRDLARLHDRLDPDPRRAQARSQGAGAQHGAHHPDAGPGHPDPDGAHRPPGADRAPALGATAASPAADPPGAAAGSPSAADPRPAHRRRRERRRRGARLSRGAADAPHRGRPRPRHVPAVRIAEAPGQLGGLGDADPRASRPGGASAAPPPTVRGSIEIGPSVRRLPFRSRPMPRAWVSLPGPEHRSSGRWRPRRARISSSPSRGSSARMSTAAPVPSSSHTALNRAWMPYERYT